MTFQPGQSGNPAGRPRGSRNKRTILAEKLLEHYAPDVTQVAIDLARRGNGPALRLCLDRMMPPMRHRLLDFDLPALKTADDAVVAADLIVHGAAHGELTVAEATALMKLVRTFTLVLAAADRAKRKAQVEVHHAEDMVRLPERDAARDDRIDDDMSIAAQGPRPGALTAAKGEQAARQTGQHATKERKTAASASSQPRAPARVSASATALRGPRDRGSDADDTLATLLVDAIARVRRNRSGPHLQARRGAELSALRTASGSPAMAIR